MPNIWNIGNTTVRNPKRIENALKVFVDEGFSGNAEGAVNEKRLHSQLKEKAVLEFSGSPSDLNGRKWRAALYQLGFISYKKYDIMGNRLTTSELFRKIGLSDIKAPYMVTPVGVKLLEAKNTLEIEEIYLRQFLSIELPNNFEKGYPEGCMKPFILFLEVLSKLNSLGLPGLTKQETGLFLQLFQDHKKSLSGQIVDKVILFRKELQNATNAKERKRVVKIYLEKTNNLATLKASSKTVFDYADTTFRYFSLSGLFKRNLGRIEIQPHKRNIVSEILKKEPNLKHSTEPLLYHELFYRNTTVIPTDVKSISIEEIKTIAKSIRDRSNPLVQKAKLVNETKTISEINNLRYELLTYNNVEREDEYAKEQTELKEIEATIKYLKVLDGQSIDSQFEIDDKPSFFEWAVWRAFLSINELVNKPSEARRFPVDYDFFPRNTAPGGGADLIFEFENFVLVVEVTLTHSHRQMAAESEPVRRHTIQYQDKYQNKEVYCLFIAPSIDNNVAESYRSGVWYKKDQEEFFNIIPMSLGDFIKSFEVFKLYKFSNSDFKQLLDRCLVGRNVRTPEWKKYITSEVLKWIKRQSS